MARVPCPDADTFIARYRPPAPYLASGDGVGLRAELSLFYAVAAFAGTIASPLSWLLCRIGCGAKTLYDQRVALERTIHAWHAARGDPNADGPPKLPPPPLSDDPTLVLRENAAIARSFLDCQGIHGASPQKQKRPSSV